VSTAAAPLDRLRAALVADPAWRRFVGAGEAWLCPECRATVPAAGPGAAGLLQAMHAHLVESCPGSAPDDGAQLRASHLAAIVRHRLAHDPHWQVRLPGRGWLCPCCLEVVAVPVDSELAAGAEAIAAHLAACADYARGRMAAGARLAEAAEPIAAPATAASGASWMDAAEAGAAVAADRDRDLSRARAVQLALMREAPSVPGYRFATRYESCTEISGDFNQFVALPGGRVGFAQGDVSGHGVQAGLIMAMANKILELYAAQGLGAKEVLAKVHEAIAHDLGGRMFITMTYAELDPATRQLRWVRAGHNPTLLHRRATGRTERLMPKGMMVGAPSAELFRKVLAEEITVLAPGDTLVLFTDGLTEAMDAQDEEFGDDRLVAVLERHAAEGPQVVVERIFAELKTFTGGRPMADDASLVVLAVDG
jgi:hypothetical protein